MITLCVEVPYASFRKSYARSFAETYPLPPPATAYGMLLSLVGERFRSRHEGVRLAFALKCEHTEDDKSCRSPCVPRIATTLRKLSRFKYGVPGKQSKLGNAPDFVETLCGIKLLIWLDSSQETLDKNGQQKGDRRTLEERVVTAIHDPASVDRYGVLCLGLSDDAVNEVRLCEETEGEWHHLLPKPDGAIELPVWVDHVGAANTRWQRYELASQATTATTPHEDEWTRIVAPR